MIKSAGKRPIRSWPPCCKGGEDDDSCGCRQLGRQRQTSLHIGLKISGTLTSKEPPSGMDDQIGLVILVRGIAVEDDQLGAVAPRDLREAGDN